jgi:hypothetical protein
MNVLNGPGTDAGENVAAVLAVADFGFVHHDLQEQIIHIGVRDAGWTDDGDLAGERMRAADAIDLPHVGRTHRSQEDAISRFAFGGEVALMEVQSFGRSAAHQRAGNCLEHGRFQSSEST